MIFLQSTVALRILDVSGNTWGTDLSFGAPLLFFGYLPHQREMPKCTKGQACIHTMRLAPVPWQQKPSYPSVIFSQQEVLLELRNPPNFYNVYALSNTACNHGRFWQLAMKKGTAAVNAKHSHAAATATY